MKKFKFTLDKLLDFKDQVLEKEKNELAALNAARLEAIEQKMSFIDEMKRTQDDFNERAARGVSPMEMMVFSSYHNSIRLRIEDQERLIEEIEQKIERQTGVVVDASKEVKSLEKLREKQLEDYRFRAAKAEESFIEEYVNGAAVRASLAEA